MDDGMWWAGQVAGPDRRRPHLRRVVKWIVAEAEEIISGRLPAMTTSPLPLPA